MSDLTFTCPHCEQSLEIPEELFGQTVECPSCSGTIQLPEPEQPDEQPSPVQSPTIDQPQKQTRDCPFCGEDILSTARKCKHCGEFLDGSSAPTPASPKNKSKETERKIWEGHPSALYYIGNWIGGIFFVLLGLSFTVFSGYSMFVAAIGIWLIVYSILDQKTRVFTHTTRKVMAKVGIISRKTHEVAIRDIRSINMHQSILERIFGLGSVQIGSAGTGGVEVEFKGITRPAKVRDGIRQTKDDLDG